MWAYLSHPLLWMHMCTYMDAHISNISRHPSNKCYLHEKLIYS